MSTNKDKNFSFYLSGEGKKKVLEGIREQSSKMIVDKLAPQINDLVKSLAEGSKSAPKKDASSNLKLSDKAFASLINLVESKKRNFDIKSRLCELEVNLNELKAEFDGKKFVKLLSELSNLEENIDFSDSNIIGISNQFLNLKQEFKDMKRSRKRNLKEEASLNISLALPDDLEQDVLGSLESIDANVSVEQEGDDPVGDEGSRDDDMDLGGAEGMDAPVDDMPPMDGTEDVGMQEPADAEPMGGEEEEPEEVEEYAMSDMDDLEMEVKSLEDKMAEVAGMVDEGEGRDDEACNEVADEEDDEESVSEGADEEDDEESVSEGSDEEDDGVVYEVSEEDLEEALNSKLQESTYSLRKELNEKRHQLKSMASLHKEFHNKLSEASLAIARLLGANRLLSEHSLNSAQKDAIRTLMESCNTLDEVKENYGNLKKAIVKGRMLGESRRARGSSGNSGVRAPTRNKLNEGVNSPKAGEFNQQRFQELAGIKVG